MSDTIFLIQRNLPDDTTKKSNAVASPDTVRKDLHVASKDIVVKKTKKGRKYYGCMGNPECDFMSWQKPSDKKCPKCGGMMLIKGNKLVCEDRECGYMENRPEE